MGGGFFVAQGAEVLVVLDFRLHLQELLVGENDELLAAVFFDDLRMDAHGGGPVILAISYRFKRNAGDEAGAGFAVFPRRGIDSAEDALGEGDVQTLGFS